MIVNGTKLLETAPIVGMHSKKMRGKVTTFGLGEIGYDIRIKQEIRFKRLFGLIPLHKVDGGRWKLGNFTLASATEAFNMPKWLGAIVHDKSTWARQGLSVFNTVIEPGWKGFLTLELVYHGRETLVIPAGSGIAQVLFHSLNENAAYTGRYQNQEDKPVPAKKAEDH